MQTYVKDCKVKTDCPVSYLRGLVKGLGGQTLRVWKTKDGYKIRAMMPNGDKPVFFMTR